MNPSYEVQHNMRGCLVFDHTKPIFHFLLAQANNPSIVLPEHCTRKDQLFQYLDH